MRNTFVISLQLAHEASLRTHKLDGEIREVALITTYRDAPEVL